MRRLEGVSRRRSHKRGSVARKENGKIDASLSAADTDSDLRLDLEKSPFGRDAALCCIAMTTMVPLVHFTWSDVFVELFRTHRGPNVRQTPSMTPVGFWATLRGSVVFHSVSPGLSEI